MGDKDSIDVLLDKKTEEYGDGVEAMESVARVWSWFLRRKGLMPVEMKLLGEDVCLMMALFKISREAKLHKSDFENYTDLNGYARLGMKVIKAKEGKK